MALGQQSSEKLAVMLREVCIVRIIAQESVKVL